MINLIAQKSTSEELVDSMDPILSKMESWKDYLLEMTPNFVVAILTFIIFLFVAKLVKNFINKYFGRFTNNQSATNIIALIFYVIILISGMMIALSFLKLDKAVTGFLAGAGIVGIALGFAFQETAANFISGTFMAFKSNFKVGDLIETNDVKAVVEKIELRSTKLKTLEGLHVILPNKNVFQSKMINHNYYSTQRITVNCGVAYNSDLEKVEKITLDCLKDIDAIRTAPSPKFYYTEFGESSINFELRFWVDFLHMPDFFDAQHLAIKKIKKTFDQEGVTIPFPMRTLDFGDQGIEINTKKKVFTSAIDKQ